MTTNLFSTFELGSTNPQLKSMSFSTQILCVHPSVTHTHRVHELLIVHPSTIYDQRRVRWKFGMMHWLSMCPLRPPQKKAPYNRLSVVDGALSVSLCCALFLQPLPGPLSQCPEGSYVLLMPSKPQKFQRFSRLAPTPVSSCLKVQGSRNNRDSTSPGLIWRTHTHRVRARGKKDTF